MEMRLPAPAAQWWEGRTLRERRLLVVMAALFVATAAWLGLVRPLMDWRSAAAERRAEATVEAAAARRDLARLAPETSGPRRAGAEGLEPLVRRTAEAAGLAADLSMGPDGGLAFRVASVPSGTGFAWLSALEADHGLRICRLGVVENADATVNLEGGIRDGACETGDATA
ncbi:MAG: type II secretion system protein M [Brevundimonas sp.]|uniref:type II secretion system protein GspM n=1 Tax=Brevundimonas sp. TaxID=1871086 RepID=UPI0017FC5697|nr:type II secretion system protein GspM [Brevundimonas sp.]MBA4804828.1 type II secretion system protein M [Brevundimonas sp.]